MVIDLSTLTKMTAGCDLWAVTTSLSVDSFTTATKLAAGTHDAGTKTCTYKVALAANTVYALVLSN
ncbi:MAG: hypothetical protein CMA59_00760 [Euryarchaeota archaeon]|nr:hypothetical protein [Euryarchaeota archaeon]